LCTLDQRRANERALGSVLHQAWFQTNPSHATGETIQNLLQKNSRLLILVAEEESAISQFQPISQNLKKLHKSLISFN
jgi:hypothetical protein